MPHLLGVGSRRMRIARNAGNLSGLLASSPENCRKAPRDRETEKGGKEGSVGGRMTGVGNGRR